MKAFAELYAALDETTKTNEKVEALTRYFSRVPPADAAWAATFLIGRRPKRLLESRNLAQWAIEESGIPEWLFGECYHAVGDFAETIALLLPPAQSSSDLPLHYWIEERLLPLREAGDEAQRAPRWFPPGVRWTNASASPGTRSSPASFAWVCRRAWWCARWRRSAAWMRRWSRIA